MSNSTRDSIYEAIASIRLIDPHTHINPHNPASETLADLLGYHYYTELAHSAGMPKNLIEEDGIGPRELVGRLVNNLSPLENTAQYRWLIEICRKFFGFEGDRLDSSNWESVYDAAETQMNNAEWPQMVLDQSNVESVFLTNDFDDDLQGFDANTYIPCLRTDDLVFHLSKPETRQRLAACTGIELDGSLTSLRESLAQRFEHFVSRGARACAISLPPCFEPTQVADGRAATALDAILQNGAQADDSHKNALSRRVFWTLAELCDEYGLPFDLMIGVNRGVYAEGVYQGQDLYDSRVSLIQYRELFNSFPSVKFPISVLASVTNQELVSYAWIFPNVITNGHWWYSNTPSFIARDAAARLEAVPQTKQIGYYSDAYKLEFVWPKFDMYRQILAGILSDHFVKGNGWSEERAVELGRQILRDNVDEIFPRRGSSEESSPDPVDTPVLVDTHADTWVDENPPPQDSNESLLNAGIAASSAALAAGAIGMVAVDEVSGNESNEDNDDSESNEIVESHDEVTEEASAEEASVEEAYVAPPIENVEELYDTLLEDSPTVWEQGTDETVRIDESDDNTDELEGSSGSEEILEYQTDFEANAPLADLPTTTSLEDTVRVDEFDEASASEPAEENKFELDPLPSVEEIQEVGVADVELAEFSSTPATDHEAFEAELNDEPLDVGDLSGDPSSTEDAPEIRMLRGEESFAPDENSLQLSPDPLTGELRFQVPGDSDDSNVEDDFTVGDDDSNETQLQETVDEDELTSLLDQHDTSDVATNDIEPAEGTGEPLVNEAQGFGAGILETLGLDPSHSDEVTDSKKDTGDSDEFTFDDDDNEITL